MIDNWPLYLEFQRLEVTWYNLEKLLENIFSDEIQRQLEEIWEQQTVILNSIMIN